MLEGTRGRRSRAQWVRDEKRTAKTPDGDPVRAGESYSTLPQIASILGRDEKTLKRRLKKGSMPPPDAFTVHGWKLWSPATVKRLVAAEGKVVRGANDLA